MQKHPIKLREVYQSLPRGYMVEIIGKKGGKFSARVLTSKQGVYAGSHTLAPWTIYKGYKLVEKKDLPWMVKTI